MAGKLRGASADRRREAPLRRRPQPRVPMPAALRAPRLLIVGCGDVGLRVLRELPARWRVRALTSTPSRRAALRAAGAVPLTGDLDRPATLQRLRGIAGQVLQLAPPPARGERDPRTAALVRALAAPGAGRAPTLVYASTTGVYGDCAGAWIDETRAAAPATDRARRRVDAETHVRAAGRRGRLRAVILRVPGIYALDRPDGDPRERVRRGAPVLVAADDVHTNHIHADDLARACIVALRRGRPQRAYHVVDDGRLSMGDHYDRVADLCGLPRPPRLSREEAARRLSPMAMTFLSESRRLSNRRLHEELRLRLRHPTVDSALTAGGEGGAGR